MKDVRDSLCAAFWTDLPEAVAVQLRQLAPGDPRAQVQTVHVLQHREGRNEDSDEEPTRAFITAKASQETRYKGITRQLLSFRLIENEPLNTRKSKR